MYYPVCGKIHFCHVHHSFCSLFTAAAANLKLMLSFAVGGLLGDVFLHLLPEAWAYVDKGQFCTLQPDPYIST